MHRTFARAAAISTVLLLTACQSNWAPGSVAGGDLGTPAAALLAGGSAPVFYRSVHVEGVEVFYREAGPRDAPVVLLLHGFPSSSHMYRDLIPALAGDHRVLAPDYPGFGFSSAPPAEDYAYDFETLARTIQRFAEIVGAEHYVLFLQDFGGPVGFRVAAAHPERVRGIVIQNATIHSEGWNPDVVAQFAPFWRERNADTEAPIRAFLRAETTRWQYESGSSRADRLSPDAWTHDQARLDRPGNDAIQLEYLWNYQDNVRLYPEWQSWLEVHRPPLLIVWGRNDPFFTMDGVDALRALAPQAEVHVYDAGHFALETHASEIIRAVSLFLATLPE